MADVQNKCMWKQLKQTCTDSCESGACVSVTCYTDSECGADAWTGADYCSGDDVWNTYRSWICNNPGTSSSSCGSSDNTQLKESCAYICENGVCVNCIEVCNLGNCYEYCIWKWELIQ